MPGDILLLDVNDKDDELQKSMIPADAMLFECSDDFEMDRTQLTGASRVKGSIAESNDSIKAATNVALLGTEVISGTAKGVVIGVGNHTEWVKSKYPDRKNN